MTEANERVIGDALLQKSYRTDFPFREVKNKGEKQQYYVENNHPAIVSREVFDAVKQRQVEKAKKSQPQVTWELTKKIFCTECGRGFRRMTVNNKAYWMCSGNVSRSENCQSLRFAEQEIFDAFILLSNKLTANRKTILTPLISQLEQMQERSGGTRDKIHQIDQNIARLTESLHVINRLHGKGILSPTDYTAQSSAVNKQVNALRTQRRQLLTEDEDDEQIDKLRELDDILAQTTPKAIFDNVLFNRIVTRITALSDTKLQFQLHGGLELTEVIPMRERRCNQK